MPVKTVRLQTIAARIVTRPKNASSSRRRTTASCVAAQRQQDTILLRTIGFRGIHNFPALRALAVMVTPRLFACRAVGPKASTASCMRCRGFMRIPICHRAASIETSLGIIGQGNGLLSGLIRLRSWGPIVTPIALLLNWTTFTVRTGIGLCFSQTAAKESTRPRSAARKLKCSWKPILVACDERL